MNILTGEIGLRTWVQRDYDLDTESGYLEQVPITAWVEYDSAPQTRSHPAECHGSAEISEAVLGESLKIDRAQLVALIGADDVAALETLIAEQFAENAGDFQ